MQLSRLATILLLPLLVACRVVPISPRSDIVVNITSLVDVNRNLFAGSELPYIGPSPEPVTAVDDDDLTTDQLWEKYVCRGKKLQLASFHDREEAAQFASPIDSRFDSTMEWDLARWGYMEYHDQVAQNCHLQFDIPQPLKDLGINPQGSDRGGPNHCFMFQHWDSSARDEQGPIPVEDQHYLVDDKWYRVSGDIKLLPLGF